MKKIIITITLLAFLNLIGCYYQEQMNPDEYKFDENSTMKVTTKDTVYNFNGNEYHLASDTLFGKVSKQLDKRRVLIYNVEIPLMDIEEVEVKRTDVLETTLLLAAILAIPITLIVLALTQGGGKTTPYGGPHGF